MHIEDYISSGILEGYVMGWATEEEILDVEAKALQYPEICMEIERIQNSLEEYALKHSKTPPAHLKENIWSQLKEVEPKLLKIPTHETSIPEAPKSVQKYLVAAAISLLMISSGLNVFLYSRYEDVKEEIAVLNAEKNTLASQFKTEQAHYSQTKSDLALIKQPGTRIIQLKGQSIDPSALATVYWDTQTKIVYLDIQNLPEPAIDKQYQLWAIVDGKPLDAGVFEFHTELGIQKMKSFETAQAFAVTLEKKGGSTSPTLTAMYVMGQI